MKAEVGKVYEHYKGQRYLVTDIAKHTETKDELVIYRKHSFNLDGEEIKEVWARPRAMFEEEIEIDGEKIHRFKKHKG